MSDDCTWNLRVGGPLLDLSNCSLLSDLPSSLSSVDAIMNVISVLDSSNVCLGNDDKRLECLHKSAFKAKTGKLIYF